MQNSVAFVLQLYLCCLQVQKIVFPPLARAAKMKWAFLDQVAWESNYIFSFGCSMSLQKLVPKINVLIDPKKAM